MSFIENNKLWILPLLGLGAAGVIWMNVRAFSPPPPIVQEATAPVEAAQEPMAAPTSSPAPGINDSLWDDLRPVAFVPPSLEARVSFEQRALSSLPPDAFSAPGAPQVVRPSGPEPSPSLRKAPGPEAPPAPAPPPDFLIDGPGGAKAWFDGHGYRIGQPLKGRPYRVQDIRILPRPGVTLQPLAPKPTPSPEVP